MSSAANLGDIFIVLDVTSLAQLFAQIINMRETGSWKTDWIVISSEQTTGQASLFTFIRSHDTVKAINSG